MRKAKVAILTEWYLPGTRAGGPVRSIHALAGLLHDVCDLYIITTDRDLGSETPYAGVIADQWVRRDGCSVIYLSPRALAENKVIGCIEDCGAQLVYINSFWSYPFSISIVRAHHSGRLRVPVLLAPRGMLGAGALSIKPLKKRVFIAVARWRGWYRGVHFHATDEREERDIRSWLPGSQVTVVNNASVLSVPQPAKRKRSGELRLFFLSRISPVKNLHMALALLKNIPPHFTVLYNIYGNIEDAKYWDRCKSVIAELPPNVQVRYCGEIGFEEIASKLEHEHVLFLPTLNENFGHSIVESMLCGCPAIISDRTPWQRLQESNAGYSLPLEESNGFVEAICRLAGMDEPTFAGWSSSAKEYIEAHIDLAGLRNAYLRMFNDRIVH